MYKGNGIIVHQAIDGYVKGWDGEPKGDNVWQVLYLILTWYKEESMVPHLDT